ncbi:MAG TPA: peptidoglycan-binding domain-containing protein, partial [Candidatus Paceibacterota bacterium]|nr:peptidoglycan-binding domain-containing protein [Candidatus Paceibacterota bacterium]
MKKLIGTGIVAIALFAATPALAQISYPTYSAGCVAPPAGLGIGASGASVSALQSFLVSQNYPGGGSWMITGYFGKATQAALRNFQSISGLPQSGMVDAATASAISNASCGGAYSQNNYQNNYYP